MCCSWPVVCYAACTGRWQASCIVFWCFACRRVLRVPSAVFCVALRTAASLGGTSRRPNWQFITANSAPMGVALRPQGLRWGWASADVSLAIIAVATSPMGVALLQASRTARRVCVLQVYGTMRGGRELDKARGPPLLGSMPRVLRLACGASCAGAVGGVFELKRPPPWF
jgi:hypothetical protein